ncbi:RNA polymerase sigma factor CnrH [Botrimarina colliarenosi]|uniref:RNA polymerase sigma factor CnrH n=2 Tax=Botrimarina TaxID=2795782 RepID=A0A5C5VXH3_9BACT|nr:MULTISPECIES: sigma-70 family RNA polymerase sigma factor [Botrimarina]TWT42653.1 RNA polymerase sigma factor CnrH [Botrimarina hoheduenensis]TWT92136.1 RNA polymerase sigma factor CnrH [Botrimarina colliarenosi]
MPKGEPPEGRHRPEEHLDPETFVSLVVTHETRVRAFIASLMLPASDVDDVFQTACMAAFRKMHDFRCTDQPPDEAFVRWFCTIAKFEVLLYYRKRRSAKVTFSTEVVEEIAELQINSLDRLNYRLEALRACIDALGDKEKMLIRMRYGNGIPVADIAERIGLSANGMYKALERVRARLLSCVKAKLRAEGLG